MAADGRPVRERAWCAVPVYNNGTTVAAVAKGCRAVLPRVLVVDDGSTDVDVAALLADTDIAVVRHPRNRGKGCALRTALAWVRERGGAFMVTLDADGQHDPAEIPKLLAALEEDPEAIVIGARNMRGPNVPRSSRFGMRFSDTWVRMETGLPVRDSQSGFRAYPVALVSELKLRGRHFDFEAEVLARAAWAGLAIRSVDVGVTYAPPGQRVSHFRPWRDNLRLTAMHARLVGRRLVPWPMRRLAPSPPEPGVRLLRHPLRFFGSLLREHATPAGLGVAGGVGVFLATLPLIGLHSVTILYVTTRLRLNRVMALSIQNLCAPPIVPVLCVQIGHVMRHGQPIRTLSVEILVHQLHERIWEWFLGALVAAPVLGIVAGLATYGIALAVRGGAARRAEAAT